METITSIVEKYINSVKLARSPHTASTYKNAMSFYLQTLRINKIDPENAPITALHEETIVLLATALKNHAATTERLYLTAVTGFFAYLAADNLTQVNLPRIKLLIQQRARKPGQRLPQFPASDIDSILTLIDKQEFLNSEDEQDHLIKLRDRAFLMTLADTGLRVHEACNLRRGDLDWNEGKAMIIGKGNKQAIIRFSTRSTDALKDYLKIRTTIDGGSKTPLSALPLFARHDRGAGKKVKPMTTTTGRNIVTDRVRELLGDEAVGTITPPFFQALLRHKGAESLWEPQIGPGTGQAYKYRRDAALRPFIR